MHAQHHMMRTAGHSVRIAPQQLESPDPRQIQIQHHQVRLFRPHQHQRITPVRRLQHPSTATRSPVGAACPARSHGRRSAKPSCRGVTRQPSGHRQPRAHSAQAAIRQRTSLGKHPFPHSHQPKPRSHPPPCPRPGPIIGHSHHHIRRLPSHADLDPPRAAVTHRVAQTLLHDPAHRRPCPLGQRIILLRDQQHERSMPG